MRLIGIPRTIARLSVAVGLLILSVPCSGQDAADDAPAHLIDSEDALSMAQRSAHEGKIADAIAALERILRDHPGLGHIELELGLLYLDAGDYGQARGYLEAADGTPQATAETRERLNRALEFATGAHRRIAVIGSISAGVEVESNPNGSPNGFSVIGPDGIPIIDPDADPALSRGPDIGFTATASVQFSYGLGDEHNNDLKLDILATGTRYVETPELNSSQLKVAFGPNLYFGDPVTPVGNVRPYVTVSLFSEAGEREFQAYGGGIEFVVRPAIGDSLQGEFDFVQRDYSNSDINPAAAEQTGSYFSGFIEYVHSFDPQVRGRVALLGETVSAQRSYWSRDTGGVQLGVDVAISPNEGRESWTVALAATYRRSSYNAPDPAVDTTRTRSEDRGELELWLGIPLAGDLLLNLIATQTWNHSNLPDYRYNNTEGLISLNYQF